MVDNQTRIQCGYGSERRSVLARDSRWGERSKNFILFNVSILQRECNIRKDVFFLREKERGKGQIVRLEHQQQERGGIQDPPPFLLFYLADLFSVLPFKPKSDNSQESQSQQDYRGGFGDDVAWGDGSAQEKLFGAVIEAVEMKFSHEQEIRLE